MISWPNKNENVLLKALNFSNQNECLLHCNILMNAISQMGQIESMFSLAFLQLLKPCILGIADNRIHNKKWINSS